jgi:hypothetical protein
MYDSSLCGRCKRLRIRQTQSLEGMINSCPSQGKVKYTKNQEGKIVSRCGRFVRRREE